MNRLIATLSLILLIFSGFGVMQNFTSQTQNFFWGDSKLADKNYYNYITEGNSRKKLETQNANYQQIFSKLGKSETSFPNFTVKLVKTVDKSKQVKVNMYTYRGNKKIDSVKFYRNISGKEFGDYRCLVYLDKKTNKIWQIEYFALNPLRGNAPGICHYMRYTLQSDGKIKSDKIFFMDESLEVVLDDKNLIY